MNTEFKWINFQIKIKIYDHRYLLSQVQAATFKEV